MYCLEINPPNSLFNVHSNKLNNAVGAHFKNARIFWMTLSCDPKKASVKYFRIFVFLNLIKNNKNKSNIALTVLYNKIHEKVSDHEKKRMILISILFFQC